MRLWCGPGLPIRAAAFDRRFPVQLQEKPKHGLNEARQVAARVCGRATAFDRRSPRGEMGDLRPGPGKRNFNRCVQQSRVLSLVVTKGGGAALTSPRSPRPGAVTASRDRM